jgi:hypothetical protein
MGDEGIQLPEGVQITEVARHRYMVGYWASPTRYLTHWFDAVDELGAFQQHLLHLKDD